MPLASAAALALASRDVQIATTSTPSTARHAGRWHLTPQFALMMPTFRERAVIRWACALCRPSARRAADAMIKLTYRQLCSIKNESISVIMRLLETRNHIINQELANDRCGDACGHRRDQAIEIPLLLPPRSQGMGWLARERVLP